MKPSDESDPLPGDQPVGDLNVERLLGRAYRPERPDDEFARRVELRMIEVAAELAGARARAMGRRSGTPPVPRAWPRWTRLAVAASLLVAAGFWLGRQGMHSQAPATAALGLRGLDDQVHGYAARPAAETAPSDAVTGPSAAATVAETAAVLQFESDPAPDSNAVDAVLVEDRGLIPRVRPAAPGVEQLAIGDSVATGAGERRQVALADSSMLYLNENTRVSLAAARRVALHAGEVYCDVAALRPVVDKSLAATADAARPVPFLVEAAGREVRALGTKFAVRSEPETATVLVTQGKVRVSDVEQPISAGQRVVLGGARFDTAAAVEQAPRASHVLDWTRELVAASESPLVPMPEHTGGAIVARDPSGEHAKLSLRKYHIDVHIEDGFARTTIDQTYFNHTSSRLEGTFFFPLPPDASLSRLAMYVEGRLMEGGMAERQHAREVFEKIVRTQKDPALLEWIDGSTFKMRVFPLEARQEKRIILSYSQRLESLYGTTRYRFPAGHSLESVRDWSFHARVKQGDSLTWRCDSHALEATRDGADLLLDAKAKDERVDRDVVLRLTDRNFSGQAAGAAARFSTTLHEGQRYWMVRYRPELPAQAQRQRRDWVFLFESAGDRDPILARVQADVIKALLANAEHDDTFAILTAGTQTRWFQTEPVAATPEHVKAAGRFLDGVHLVGALDLGLALEAARPVLEAAKNPYLVHVGSAIAVLGERSDDKLMAAIPSGTRYVGVGVGKRWSRQFMKTAAGRTGGYYTQVNPDEAVAWRGFELYSILNTPRLLNISVVDEAERAAFLVHDDSIAHGEEICAIARWGAADAPPAKIIVSGKVDGADWRREIAVANVAEQADYLPRSWAKLRIDRLLAEDPGRHREEITSLSKAMYVMSPFTSLLVLETERMYVDFGVDRGRKDHWAMYPCPNEIPVVYEPLPAAPAVAGPGAPAVRQPTWDVLSTMWMAPLVPTQQDVLPYFELYRFGSDAGDFSNRANIERRLYRMHRDGLQLPNYQAPFLAPRGEDSYFWNDFSPPNAWIRVPDPSSANWNLFELRVAAEPEFLEEAEAWRTRLLPLYRLGDIPVDRYGFSARRLTVEGEVVDGRNFRGGGFGRQDAALKKMPSVDDQIVEQLLELERRKYTRLGGLVRAPRLSAPDVPLSGGDWANPEPNLWRFQALDDISVGGRGVKLRRELGEFNGRFRAGRSLGLESLVEEKSEVTRRISLDLVSDPVRARSFFGDLLAFAPGMHTSVADVWTVMEAESDAFADVKAGEIDPRAESLIRNARQASWHRVTVPIPWGIEPLRVVCDGTGRFISERVTAEGLFERVVCDGSTRTDVYPELGVAARRAVSRFHQAELQSLVPWLLPAAAELARGADLKLLGDSTVAVVPHRAAGVEGENAPRVELHLVFEPDGRMVERRWVEMPAARVQLRETYAADGTVKRIELRGTQEHVVAELKLGIEPAAAPELELDLKDLVVVPLPVRTRQFVSRSRPALRQRAYESWSEPDAMAMIAALLVEHPADLTQIIGRRFLSRGDRRIGFYTLLMASGVVWDPQTDVSMAGGAAVRFDPAADHPSSTLAKYIFLHEQQQSKSDSLGEMDLGGRAESSAGVVAGAGELGRSGGFVPEFARLRDLHVRWKQALEGDDERRRVERDRILEFARSCRSPVFGWAMLRMVLDQSWDAAAYGSIGEVCRRYEAYPLLANAARYERARMNLKAGDPSTARALFGALHVEARERGVLLAIDESFFQAFQDGDGPARKRALLLEAAGAWIEARNRPAAVVLAWQCHKLGDASLADELLAVALAGVPDGERFETTLAAVSFLYDTEQYARADALFQPLLEDPHWSGAADIWRIAAKLAELQGMTSRSVSYLDRALDLEYRRIADSVELAMVRSSFGELLGRYRQLADAIRALPGAEPVELVPRVVRAADRWRSLDSDGAEACYAAAGVLERLGARELAWDYATTSLVSEPGSVPDWAGLAQTLRQDGSIELARRAYDWAFQAEPSNPLILNEHAQMLEQSGRSAAAAEYYRRIAEGTWGGRFQEIHTQARKYLKAR